MRRRTRLLLLALSMAVACGERPRLDADFSETPDAGTGRGDAQPPISGGTLLITRDARWAVAADPDANRIAIVGISADTPGCTSECQSSPQLLADIEIAPGEEPGRLAEDGDGRVHVVLRRGAAIATIDLASRRLLARRPVCVAPRGIAYDESANLLHVACASGDLVSLTPDSGQVVRRIVLDLDLRDVVVVPDGLVVSRFKSARLIRLDHAGHVLAQVQPAGIERASQDLTDLTTDPLESGVAWRTVSTSSGTVFVLHQYALARKIDLGSETSPAPPAPYRAVGSACGGIVAQSVSMLAPGAELEMGMPLPVVALSVDVATSSTGEWLAVAHPGAASVEQDRVTIYRAEALPSWGRSPVRCAESAGRVIVDAQPVAVAMIPGRTPAEVAESDWLVVQTRNPRQLRFYSGFAAPHATVALDGPQGDVGHDLFHLDAGSGIACAQCHVEGAEDGRVWNFEPLGARRTQALHVGLEGTAPFRWDGAHPSLADLIADVFVVRMGLPRPARSELESLEQWLVSLRPPPRLRDPRSEPAVRGRALFESPDVGCTKCHAGAAVARDTNVDVGVDSPQAFQVPALRGVGYRAPFMHDGCAQTLRERFDSPCGGGDLHGRTSLLSAAEIDDLIAYLESL